MRIEFCHPPPRSFNYEPEIFKVKWSKFVKKHSGVRFKGTSVGFWFTLYHGIKHIEKLRSRSFVSVQNFLLLYNGLGNFIIWQFPLSCIFFLSNSISTAKMCPLGLPRLTLSKSMLNFNQEWEGCSLMQPVGMGFVIAKPYWLFSSTFKILAMMHLSSSLVSPSSFKD